MRCEIWWVVAIDTTQRGLQSFRKQNALNDHTVDQGAGLLFRDFLMRRGLGGQARGRPWLDFNALTQFLALTVLALEFWGRVRDGRLSGHRRAQAQR